MECDLCGFAFDRKDMKTNMTKEQFKTARENRSKKEQIKMPEEQDDAVEYLYKITVEIDDEKVRTLGEHDLDAVYRTVRDTFTRCDFTERSKDNHKLIFTIEDCKDAFSDVGLATNALHDSWLGKYIKRMDWYDAGDGSTEDVLAEIRSFDDKYGK